jgi:hypothetical protein
MVSIKHNTFTYALLCKKIPNLNLKGGWEGKKKKTDKKFEEVKINTKNELKTFVDSVTGLRVQNLFNFPKAHYPVNDRIWDFIYTFSIKYLSINWQ